MNNEIRLLHPVQWPENIYHHKIPCNVISAQISYEIFIEGCCAETEKILITRLDEMRGGVIGIHILESPRRLKPRMRSPRVLGALKYWVQSM